MARRSLEMDILESYDKIKELLRTSSISDDDIKKLVSIYEKHINCRRSTFFILNLTSLINTLEKRLLVDEYHIKPILQIMSNVKIDDSKELEKQVNHHITLLYKWNQHPKLENLENNKGANFNEEWLDISTCVLSFIVNNIAPCTWKEFAKILGFNEHETNEKYFEKMEQRQKCLKQLLGKYDVFTVRQHLLQALTRIRRNDIKEHVEEMFINEERKLGFIYP